VYVRVQDKKLGAAPWKKDRGSRLGTWVRSNTHARRPTHEPGIGLGKKRYSIGSHGSRADARQVAAAGEAMQSEASSPAGAVQVRSESDAAVHVRGQTCMVDARTTGRQVAAAGRVTPPPLPAGA
jgi:hypothetical protein